MSTVQPGAAPRLGYLGTTASSRAKVSQDPPSPSLSSEPLPGPDRPEDQSSDAPSSQKYQPLMASPQALGTPTEEPSQGGASRWSVGSSSEETPTNQSQTLIIVSPAPSVTPTKRDIIKSDITSCSVSRQEDDRESDSTSGAPPTSSCAPPTSSCPLSEGPRQTGENESVSLQQCQQVANELRQTARRAARLHRKLIAERRLQMSSVLQEAFVFVHYELHVVLQGEGQGLQGEGRGSEALSGPQAVLQGEGRGSEALSGPQAVLQGEGRGSEALSGPQAVLQGEGRGLQDEGTMSLLEKYSELLVQMTQNKLNRI